MLVGDAADLYKAVHTSGLDVSSDAIKDAWSEVIGGGKTWMLLTYKNPSELALFASGTTQ
jgi:hypothetical protein